MATAVPNLSEAGWITNPKEKADIMFAHFFLAEFSQTQFYPGRISSFPYIVQTSIGDVDRFVEITRETLKNYFRPLYSKVSVEMTFKESTSKPGTYVFDISVILTDETGTEYSVAKAGLEIDSKTARVLNFNNTGE